LIQAIAAGRTAGEIKEKKEVKEKPSEEDIVKSIAFGRKIETAPIVKSEEEPEKKGFFAKLKEKIVTKKVSEKQFDDIFWELEVALLENNVAVEVIEKIKNDLKKDLTEKPVLRNKVDETVVNSLKNSIKSLFETDKIDIFQRLEKKKPLVMCFVGVNGSGKTTTIAKVAAMLQKYKLSSVIAASDTFRAAAINQLEEHAAKLGVRLIKHDYGADPAAVAFDAIKYAESKGIDAVLIDTAGRLHSNVNLMDEMKKIIRVAKPDLKIFIGESITGNDCVEQAKQFNEAIGIDGIILSKADVDEKGGAAISVSYVTKKPIMYIGTGQRYEDLEEFDSEKIIKSLGL
jgi:fused signal recognition particle receptor